MEIYKIGNSANEPTQQYKINEDKVSSESEKQAANRVTPEEKVSLSSTARDIQQPANSAASEETVSLSSTAKDIQLAEKAIERLPDVREEKVQELKSQIETGNYNVNGEKIAGKMLGEAFLNTMA